MVRPTAAFIAAVGTLCCAVGLVEAEEVGGAVSRGDQRLAQARGVVSGHANVCGLDWENRNFVPMMARFRARGLDEGQTAFLATLHGVAMRIEEQKMRGCDARRRAVIERQLDYQR